MKQKWDNYGKNTQQMICIISLDILVTSLGSLNEKNIIIT